MNSGVKKSFPQGSGSGKTLGNPKAGPKSVREHDGYKQGSGTGKALHGEAPKSKREHDGYKLDNGTGKDIHGVGPSKPSKMEGFKQGKGTGHALHGEAPSSHAAKDGYKQGKGTGRDLAGKVQGPHNKGQIGAHPGSEKNSKGSAALKNKVPYSQKNYGLKDSSKPKDAIHSLAEKEGGLVGALRAMYKKKSAK